MSKSEKRPIPYQPIPPIPWVVKGLIAMKKSLAQIFNHWFRSCSIYTNRLKRRHEKPAYQHWSCPQKKPSWEPFLVDLASTLQKLPEHEELLSGFGEDARRAKPQESDPSVKQMTAAARITGTTLSCSQTTPAKFLCCWISGSSSDKSHRGSRAFFQAWLTRWQRHGFIENVLGLQII